MLPPGEGFDGNLCDLMNGTQTVPCSIAHAPPFEKCSKNRNPYFYTESIDILWGSIV